MSFKAYVINRVRLDRIAVGKRLYFWPNLLL